MEIHTYVFDIVVHIYASGLYVYQWKMWMKRTLYIICAVSHTIARLNKARAYWWESSYVFWFILILGTPFIFSDCSLCFVDHSILKQISCVIFYWMCVRLVVCLCSMPAKTEMNGANSCYCAPHKGVSNQSMYFR